MQEMKYNFGNVFAFIVGIYVGCKFSLADYIFK